MNDPSVRRTVVVGWLLLAVYVPMGLTLEALHAFKTPAYLESATRWQMWRLAHAHGNWLGILCLVFGALAPRWMAEDRGRRAAAHALIAAAILLPLGFFLGGILNTEGDPGPGILLVPLGGVALVYALIRSALATRGSVPPP